MPTVLQIGPYRLFFYSADGSEPPHIHVERESAVAKFWLAPVRLARSGGFVRHELNSVEEIVQANARLLLEAWNDFFRA